MLGMLFGEGGGGLAERFANNFIRRNLQNIYFAYSSSFLHVSLCLWFVLSLFRLCK